MRQFESMETAELVRLTQGDDKGARAELLARAAGLVYTRVRRALGDVQAAEDAAQDALLAALAGLPRLRNAEAFIGWLRRITDNVIADHHARRKRTPLSTDAVETEPDSRPQPEAVALRSAEAESVKTAMRQLKPRSRLAVELFYFHGLSGREVAEFLGISREAARAVLSRARTEMRKGIENMGTKGMKDATKMEERQATAGSARRMIVSGSEKLMGPLFEIGSASDRLYSALYPGGDIHTASREAGLSAEEAEREARFLEEARLVAPRGNGWRCTMPIASDIDAEILRPWAEPLAAGAIERLGTVHAELIRLSEQASRGLARKLDDGDIDSARRTAIAAGLMEAVKRPFGPLEEQLRSSAPYRGRYGSFRIALFDFELPSRTTGAFAVEQTEECISYWLWPSAVARPGIGKLVEEFQGDPRGGTRLAAGVVRQLAAMAHRPLTEELQRRIARDLEVPEDKTDAFWKRLEVLRAVGRRNGQTVAALAAVPREPWEKCLSHMDAIGAEILTDVTKAADDLRRRVMHCSFVDCDFGDAVLVFVMFLFMLVQQATETAGWIKLPAEADYSWGALAVTSGAAEGGL